jgi:hypothetical protein
MPGIAVHENDVQEGWFKYERIKVMQDEHGRAMAANFAVIDVLWTNWRGKTAVWVFPPAGCQLHRTGPFGSSAEIQTNSGRFED